MAGWSAPYLREESLREARPDSSRESGSDLSGVSPLDYRSAEISAQRWPGILASFQPSLGRYGWMFHLARLRQRQVGFFPIRFTQLLARHTDPKRPYFIGRTRQGVRFLGDVRDYDSWRWAVGDIGDARLVGILAELQKSHPGAFLDVGTNCGILAASVAAQTPGQALVGFEPIPATARRAAATFVLNGLDNARLFQMAVGAAEGSVLIHEYAGHSGGASATRTLGATNTVPASVATLDALVASLGLEKVGLIKIDVEGFEPEVLRGAQDIIATHRPALAYEWNEPSVWTPGEANELIQRSGGGYRFSGVTLGGAYVDDLITYSGVHIDVIARPATNAGLPAATARSASRTRDASMGVRAESPTSGPSDR